MQIFKKIVITVLILFVVLISALYLTNTDYLLKAVRTIYLNGHTTAFLDDYQYFENHVVEDGEPQPWPIHKDYNSVNETETLNVLNAQNGSIAYMILKNDSIWFENYYDGYGKDSKTNSFSMAKSMISAMLGKAIMEGKIKSLDQKVGDFYPQYKDGLAGKLTVGDLSSMASGLQWDEAYSSPFSITTRAYFDKDLEGVMLDLPVVEEPGQSYKYLSGNTELLGMVIEKATGKTMSQYLSDSFWKPMGAEHEALWQIDSEEGQLEKAYCCVASNARDFARFGKLYKDYGKWNGKQLLDSAFIAKSITPRFKESPEYGYGWWLLNHLGKHFFMMRGHLGQYVMVEPDDNIIIIRLGHKSSKVDGQEDPFYADIYTYLEEGYKMLQMSDKALK
ncbi:CubicO group peptidase, beta-lactamase class C family [Flavobacteriaceae bacterium MAR_2010_188]|nr:CubicO group peptidase, beta-lactamase class C family [Flavobacteriaceae bacterium MAR_2010_188]